MATVTRTIPFDAAEFFSDPADQAELLNEALASGNAAFVANVLGTIARARGMAKVAQEVGVTREGLYRALSDKGDPKLTTFLGVLSALQLELAAKPGKSRKLASAKTKARPRRKAA
ncbi:MAG: putative addiction module antidote protein [Rhodospirillales bacterium]|nr:putative addiction module antidote protein [Rhodospirillales bacterium]